MPSDHTPDTEALFQQALDLSGPARARFLDERCPPGSAARREIDDLLAHFEAAGGDEFLEHAPVELPTAGTRAPAEAPPERIGPYHVLEELGRGGMGVVYLARDPGLERRIAIKLLPAAVAADTAWQQHIRHEARLLASLNHPNIATIHSLEQSDDRCFLTMEYVSGEPLSTRIAEGTLRLRDVLRIGTQLAAALEAAHRNGVVHRDLKPQNVMVTADDVVKVLDFGVARSMHRRSTTSGDPAGSIVGTIGYMSPEQLRGEPADQRADLWAFGCVLFECLARRRAFAGSTIGELVTETLEREPDWDALEGTYPARIRDVLERCLQTAPADRPDSASWVRRELEEEIAVRALRTVRAETVIEVPNNLPVPLNRFVGRRTESRELAELLAPQRVVTVTGPGGAGKSRLALEVARQALKQWTDGAWFVDLTAIHDAELLPQTIATALGLREQAQQTLIESIGQYLADRHLLLILDNCEHLLDAVADAAHSILQSSPGVSLLATSRERLAIAGELAFPLSSLQVPTGTDERTVEALGESESVQLFVDRARAARPDFLLTERNAPLVARICRRLDGIPLAIELAAARTQALTVQDIAERLGERFHLLASKSRTVLPHHQTLQATIDWSHELLTGPERVLFRRLAAFAAGWTLRAAESVCAGDGIDDWEILDLHSRLVEQSLIEIDAASPEHQTRYRMLEMVREYARERLHASGEEDATAERFRAFFLELIEEAEPELRGPNQGNWFERLEFEHDNLGAVLTAAAERDDATPLALRMVCALGRFWAVRGYWREGLALIQSVLEQAGGGDPSSRLARAHSWAGTLSRLRGEQAAARRYIGESLAIGRALDDRAVIATALSNLGHLHQVDGDYADALALYEEVLPMRRALGDERDVAITLTSIGSMALAHGDLDRAEQVYGEMHEIVTRLGDPTSIAESCANLARLASDRGDLARSRELNLEVLAIGRRLGNRRSMAGALQNLGRAAYLQEAYGDARAYYEESLTLRREIEDPRGICYSLTGLAFIDYVEGRLDQARVSLAESLEIGRGLNDPSGISYALTGLGHVDADRGELDSARESLVEALEIHRHLGDQSGIAVTIDGLAAIAGARGDSERVAQLFAASTALRERETAPVTPAARLRRDMLLAAARTELGDADFEAAWQAGRSMTIEAIIEAAGPPAT